MAEAIVTVNSGSGIPIKVYNLGDGSGLQYVKHAYAATENETFWTASTTATTSVIAADSSRVGLLIVNNSTGRVYFRFDSTAPTSATNGQHWYLEAGERWEVPLEYRCLAMSVIAAIASGHVVFHTATVV